MIKSMLIDTSKCMGCRACQTACKQWNQLPAEPTRFSGTYENPPGISPITWTRVVFKEYEDNEKLNWYFCKQGCMHCNDAACITVCPTGAMHQTSYGTVNVNNEKCIGCNYCAANCPFHVISFDRKTNLPPKCTFWYDRVINGLKPACAATCPTGAIQFGSRREMIALASKRIGELHSQGKDNVKIYGLEEVNGTGMIYILEKSADYYGLPLDPNVPFSARLWGALFKPLRVFVVLALGFGLWSNRTDSHEILEARRNNEKAREIAPYCYPEPGKDED